MNKLRCKLIASSDVEHLHQIYAGFAMLHRSGEIELEQVIDPAALENRASPGRWNDYRFFNTTVVINGRIRVTYDTHDWAWIDPEILAKSDMYFKRSFSSEEVQSSNLGEKVHPLGLNMQVNDVSRDIFRFRRARMYGGTARVKTILKSMRVDAAIGSREVERLDNFEFEPSSHLKPRVLYMARVWDPKNVESRKQSEAVEAMNVSRAESVRRLRKELGDRFFGGLARDEYSERYFQDVLVGDGRIARKRNYLNMLREFPICVATVGLNGSNGWKLAEYVAGSKAIISEPLVYAVPGPFQNGTHYLEFTGPEGLVTAARRLVDDSALRISMMKSNREYFTRYVRPDAIIRNSLETVSGLLR